MPAKADPAAAAAAADPSEHLLQVIDRSTEASRAASEAATASTEAMRQALLSLPDLLATALTKTGAGAGATANANPSIARTVTPRDLRDRKVPDFWEHNPKAWFVIFENHVNSASTALTEPQKFALLLPLLSATAVKKLSRFINTPGNTVFTDSKARLLLHFERTKEEMAAELINISSLGDRTAVDLLEHMRSLQPGDAEGVLFRHIFMRSLPSHVTGIVSREANLDDMAKAADVVLRSVPEPSTPASASSADSSFQVEAIRRDQLVGGLCFVHSKYGREAYNCALPDSCRMKNVLHPRPTGSSQRGFGNRGQNHRSGRQGNANAGRQ